MYIILLYVFQCIVYFLSLQMCICILEVGAYLFIIVYLLPLVISTSPCSISLAV